MTKHKHKTKHRELPAWRESDTRDDKSAQVKKAATIQSPDAHSDDPLMFEVDSLQLEIAALMCEAHIRDELIYGYLRTGLIVTEENYDLLTPEDQRAWDNAIEEYEARIAVEAGHRDRSKGRCGNSLSKKEGST
jgi:hypothetical protein